MTDSKPTAKERLDNGEDALYVALDLANVFRTAIGHPVLEKLPYAGASRSDATDCVLAMAIDADVAVLYDVEHQDYNEAISHPGVVNSFRDGGAAVFTIEANARAFAQAAGVDDLVFSVDTTQLDAHTHHTFQMSAQGVPGIRWIVPIQDELTAIARAFDESKLASTYLTQLEWLDFGEKDFYDAIVDDGVKEHQAVELAASRGELDKVPGWIRQYAEAGV